MKKEDLFKNNAGGQHSVVRRANLTSGQARPVPYDSNSGIRLTLPNIPSEQKCLHSARA